MRVREPRAMLLVSAILRVCLLLSPAVASLLTRVTLVSVVPCVES